MSAGRKESGKGSGGSGKGRRSSGLSAGRAGQDAAPEADDRAFEPTMADFGDPRPAWEDVPLGPDQVLGRVVRLDRGYPLVVTDEGAFRCEHAIALVKSSDLRACVGDAVVARLPGGHDKGHIDQILPRATELSRWDGRRQGERQVLAANLDLVIVVQAVSRRPITADRVARSAVLACQGGMRFCVALTKADRADEGVLEADEQVIRRVAGEEVPIVRTAATQGLGVEEVRALIAPGTCAVLLGESGAGKSTLVNALLGAEVLGTSTVRGRDDAGRHTTVARRMLAIPGGGVVADAPGLRSLPLLDEDRGLALAFPDVAALVPTCRFRDCTHGNEPGCAVRAAVDAEQIPEERLAVYRQLMGEMHQNRLGLDPSAAQSVTV